MVRVPARATAEEGGFQALRRTRLMANQLRAALGVPGAALGRGRQQGAGRLCHQGQHQPQGRAHLSHALGRPVLRADPDRREEGRALVLLGEGGGGRWLPRTPAALSGEWHRAGDEAYHPPSGTRHGAGQLARHPRSALLAWEGREARGALPRAHRSVGSQTGEKRIGMVCVDQTYLRERGRIKEAGPPRWRRAIPGGALIPTAAAAGRLDLG